MKDVFRFAFWSNIFFLIPLLYAIKHNLDWYALIIGATFISSTLFHFTKEKSFRSLDTAFSTLLVISNIILIFQGKWRLPFSVIALVCAFLAILFYKRQRNHNYNNNHSLWHICSAGVCLFCLATYLT